MSIPGIQHETAGKKFTASKGERGLKRKIVWLTVVLFLLAGIMPGMAFGHPPKSVILGYDAPTKMLKVTILHPSFTPSWHYIKTVAIEKNKQSVGSFAYKNQPGDEFSYTYEIMAAPGDTFVVNVYCSMYGSRTASLTIPMNPKP